MRKYNNLVISHGLRLGHGPYPVIPNGVCGVRNLSSSVEEKSLAALGMTAVVSTEERV